MSEAELDEGKRSFQAHCVATRSGLAATNKASRPILRPRPKYLPKRPKSWASPQMAFWIPIFVFKPSSYCDVRHLNCLNGVIFFCRGGCCCCSPVGASAGRHIAQFWGAPPSVAGAQPPRPVDSTLLRLQSAFEHGALGMSSCLHLANCALTPAAVAEDCNNLIKEFVNIITKGKGRGNQRLKSFRSTNVQAYDRPVEI